jgi:hypothetical protein
MRRSAIRNPGGRRAAMAGVALTLSLLLGSPALVSCAGSTGDAGSVSDSSLATTSVPAPDLERAQTTASSTTSPPATAIFEELAVALAPMPVYGLRQLPAGVSVAELWWPVIELESPDEYQGEKTVNPWMVQSPEADPQAQVVLEVDEGWAVVFANFRGDLGDVQGEPVGSVGGHDAFLFEVNGGVLAQWSDGGRWYGVFGRNVSREAVASLVGQMVLIEP